MKKKIFVGMCICSLIGIIITSGVLGLFVKTHFTGEMKSSLADVRVTIIEKGGIVTLDNKNNKEILGSHIDRPEVIEAFEKGEGRAERFSQTDNEMIYYYCIKISDNEVLRLAIQESAVSSLFSGFIAILALIVLVAIFICTLVATKFTKRVVAPINRINLDSENIEIYDELAPLVRKITAQRLEIKKQVARIKSRSDTIKVICENMKEGIIFLDEKSVIISANSSANLAFGGTLVMDKGIAECTRNLHILDNVKNAIAGESSNYILQKDGKTYHMFFNSAPQGGGVIFILDITLSAQNEKIRREFSANISHELKTPLTIISGFAELIENEMVPKEDQKVFAAKIKNEAQRMGILINDIINLSELDEKSTDIAKEFMCVNEVVKEVMADLQPMAMEKNISLNITGGEVVAKVNKKMLYELFQNLIDNAIIYNKEGGSVNVTLEQAGERAEIIVSDTGIGIAKEHIGRIFERFYRVDKSRSKKTGGTGLGLSIVKHIVEVHGGEIGIDSNADGTTIKVTL